VGLQALKTTRRFRATVVAAPTSADIYSFAEIPEIVFVAGFAETEQLGLYTLHSTNRVRPGDLFWRDATPLQRHADDGGGNWAPIVTTALIDSTGASATAALSAMDVTYSSSTGVLTYGGGGTPGSLFVRISATSRNTQSDLFRIRVLVPKVIWGTNAPSRTFHALLSAVPKFHTTTPLSTASVVSHTATDADPYSILILGGSYEHADELAAGGRATDWRIGASTQFFKYILGEPGNRPSFKDSPRDPSIVSTNPGGSRSLNVNLLDPNYTTGVTGYFKNLTLRGTVDITGITAASYVAQTRYTARKCSLLYAFGVSSDGFGPSHDDATVLDALDPVAGAARGGPRPGSELLFFSELCEYKTWIGVGSNYHNIYQHGRPSSWTIINGCHWTGKNDGSQVKTTHFHVRVRNSQFYTRSDIAFNGVIPVTGKCVDAPSTSDVVVYNNHFVAENVSSARRTEMFLWFNPRRSIWGGNDGYANVNYQSAPFQPFNLYITDSGVASTGTNVRLMVRPWRSGAWTQVTATITYSGTSNHWNAMTSPTAFPNSGWYELQLISDQRALTETPPTNRQVKPLQVYRNASYFLAAGTFPWDQGADTLRPWADVDPKRWCIDDGRAYWAAARGTSNLNDTTTTAYLYDGTNPYTHKHFVSFNTFETLNDIRPTALIQDQSTYPNGAIVQGESQSRYGLVPPNWHPCSISFFSNNKTVGYTTTNMAESSQWIDLTSKQFGNTPADQWQPGPVEGRMVPVPLPLVADINASGQVVPGVLQSNVTPATPNAQKVTLPSWWRI
jgi:hypothetical protein